MSDELEPPWDDTDWLAVEQDERERSGEHDRSECDRSAADDLPESDF